MFENPDSNLESQSRLSEIASPVFEIPTPMLEISKPCLDALRTHCIFLKNPNLCLESQALPKKYTTIVLRFKTQLRYA